MINKSNQSRYVSPLFLIISLPSELFEWAPSAAGSDETKFPAPSSPSKSSSNSSSTLISCSPTCRFPGKFWTRKTEKLWEGESAFQRSNTWLAYLTCSLQGPPPLLPSCPKLHTTHKRNVAIKCLRTASCRSVRRGTAARSRSMRKWKIEAAVAAQH